MKFCCEKFEFDVKLPSTSAPNIRIVKFNPQVDWDLSKLYYGFFITMGYDKYSLYLPMSNISFCPHCGINLKEFYKNTSYINEIEGKTF
jgi:hypothetical protein